MSKIIMGIRMQQRRETAQSVQAALTDYGCYIKTRLGLHQASDDSCSEQGIILLEFIDNADDKADELEKALKSISSVEVLRMTFK